MFSIVAPRYDFITRAFSYGMDRHWKRTGLDRANLRDLGTLPMIRFYGRGGGMQGRVSRGVGVTGRGGCATGPRPRARRRGG
jgi:hypothetical protein